MNYTHFKHLLHTKVSNKIVLCSLGALVIALLIFQAGIFVGYHKASFSYRSGDNFHRMFGTHKRSGMMDKDGMRGFMGGDFTSAYGTTGTILKISLPTIVVAGTDKVEKIIVVGEKTLIRRFREDVNEADLKVGDLVIVIGSPDDKAQIEARLIRVLPSSVFIATTTAK